MKLRVIPGSLLLLALAGCPREPVGPQPEPYDAGPWDGAPVWVDGGREPKNEYEAACANLERQGCPEAHPEGKDCPTSIREASASPGLGISAGCIRLAQDKDALRKCLVRCGGR